MDLDTLSERFQHYQKEAVLWLLANAPEVLQPLADALQAHKVQSGMEKAAYEAPAIRGIPELWKPENKIEVDEAAMHQKVSAVVVDK